MDWRGRTREREVKLHLFSNFATARAALTMDWRGRARERQVKLQLLYVPCNPSHGLAWSNART